MNDIPAVPARGHYHWPIEGLRRIPDWVYTDPAIYQREVERIFHGRTWNYVALEAEISNPGDFIRSNVGPTPVVVTRGADGAIHAFENRCAHRAAEFCRELSGNAKELVCPYHQWTYALDGRLRSVPFRRGVAGKGGMPAAFDLTQHGPRRLKVTTHRGVVSPLTRRIWNPWRTISAPTSSVNLKLPSTAVSFGCWATIDTHCPATGNCTTKT
jgi:anthranilate 1,2-dioxygenase large subunit